MSLTIAKLAAERRSFTWHYDGEDVAITYRPAVLTLHWIQEGGPYEAMASAIVTIDIIDGDGKPIALDVETLKATIPFPVCRKINQAIWEDASLDPTTAETSGVS